MTKPEVNWAEECRPCGGVGVVGNPLWNAWWQRHEAARKAWQLTCDAHANWHASDTYKAIAADAPGDDEPEEIQCRTCKGVGEVPTDAGLALLTFLRRHQPRGA